jgi:hypothetical protein
MKKKKSKKKAVIAPFWSALDPLAGAYTRIKRSRSETPAAKRRFDEDFSRTIKLLQNKCRRWGYDQSEDGRRKILALLIASLFPETTSLSLWIPEAPTYDELLERCLTDPEILAEVMRYREHGNK